MEYSKKEALDAIMGRLSQRNVELARLVQTAVDTGKYVERSEPILGKGDRKHTFQKVTNLSDQEALNRALEVLEAYFLEQPMYWSSLNKDLQETLIVETSKAQMSDLPLFKEVLRQSANNGLSNQNLVKTACIDFESETQLDQKSSGDVFNIPNDLDRDIATQATNLSRLKALCEFGDAQ